MYIKHLTLVLPIRKIMDSGLGPGSDCHVPIKQKLKYSNSPVYMFLLVWDAEMNTCILNLPVNFCLCDLLPLANLLFLGPLLGWHYEQFLGLGGKNRMPSYP